MVLVSIGGVLALRAQTPQIPKSSVSNQKPCPAQAYDQDAPEPAIVTTSMSADVREGYRQFRAKCGLCHSLNQQAAKSESTPQDWTNMVFRMRDMPSSHMSETEAKAIVTFVIWEADYSNDLVKTLMAFDRNGDGKLEKSEVPERMQGLFDRADTKHRGVLSAEEIRKYAEAQSGSVVAASGNCDPEQRLKN